MKNIPLVSGIVAAVTLASATVLSAGVVMQETAVATGPSGHTSEKRTVYVQGNKQKVETAEVQTITDLDKRIVYIIDKSKKDYVELPLRKLDAKGLSAEESQESIQLKRTGKKQQVGYHSCEEYRGTEASEVGQVTIKACVSDSAPGVAEVTAFESRMVAQILGAKAPQSNEPSPGIVLEKSSVVKLKLPDAKEQGFRIASLTAMTRINNIEVKRLPAETFKPPKGFSMLKNKPENIPENVESVRFDGSPRPTTGVRFAARCALHA